MRLTELEPRWVGCSADGDDRHGLGVGFMCPLHNDRNDRLVVWFANPVDGGAAHVVHSHVDPVTHTVVDEEFLWQRTGETFDDLTLMPSVDASKYGHWHGFISSGEVK